MADTYTELYVEPGATNASNINGGSSRERLFQRTNGNWNTSTKVFTATGDTLSTDWIGQVACVIADGGTAGAYFAVVTAIDNSAKTITLSTTRTLGTAPTTLSTGRTITIGGAWAGMSGSVLFPFSIGTWHSLKDTSTRVRINLCGSFSVTSTVQNNSASVPLRGFATTPGDGGFSTITYTGSGNSSAMTCGGTYYLCEIESIWFKNQSNSATRTVCHGCYFNPASGLGFGIFRKCRFSDCVSSGLYASASTNDASIVVENCEFFDCAKNMSTGTAPALKLESKCKATVSRCLFHDNVASGCSASIESLAPLLHVSESVFDTNTVSASVYSSAFDRCAFYNNTTAISGSTSSSSWHVDVTNSVFEGNTTVADTVSAVAGRSGILRECGFYNNTTVLSSNATGSNWVNSEAINLSSSPFVDAANGDFRTRSTALRNYVDGTLLQSSDYYSKSTSFRRDIGIGPSNPFYRGQ